MTRFYLPSTSIYSTGLVLLALSASAVQTPTCEDLGIDLNQDSCREYCSSLGYDGVTTPGSSLVSSTSTSSCMCKGMNDNTLETICQSDIIETSPSSTSPAYSPKSTCESMGITNIDECEASCLMYFGPDANPPLFGPTNEGPDGEPLYPQFCHCGWDGGSFIIRENERYICGATTDDRFNCSDVNVTDVSTCDDTCKQDTSTPGTTFKGDWIEEYKQCECMAEVPNNGTFFYCGGPPSNWPTYSPTMSPPTYSPSSPSSSSLRGWGAGLIVLTATIMATAL